MSEQAINKTIGFIIDTTISMSSAFDALLKSLDISGLLNIIGIKMKTITYGDYNEQLKKLTQVTSVFQGDEIMSYKFEHSPNGNGGDQDEAVASAFHRAFDENLDHAIFITDAMPHNSIDSSRSDEADFEKSELERLGLKYKWKDVVSKVKSLDISCILQNRFQNEIYKGLGECYLTTFTHEKILVKILEIINVFLTQNDVTSTIDSETYITIFQEFIRKNPFALEHVSFLSNMYFNHISTSHLYTNLHSTFCTKLPENTRAMINKFKDEQAKKIKLCDINEEYPDLLHVLSNDTYKFGMTKDIFVGNKTGADAMRILKKMMNGLTIVPKGTPNSLSLSCISNNPSLLGSLLSMNIETCDIPEFSNGILPILTSAVFQYCNLEEIVKLFDTSKIKMLDWALPDSTVCVNATWWNRYKLDFVATGLSMKKANFGKYIKTLNRMILLVDIIGIFKNNINIKAKTSLKYLTPQHAVEKTTDLILFFDVVLGIWMSPTTAFKCSHEEVLGILKNIKKNNNFYEKSNDHIQMITDLSKEFDGLVLSIYSINADVRDDLSKSDTSSIRFGYMDSYAQLNYTTLPIPQGNLRQFYLDRVGVDGEHVISTKNSVNISQIKVNGPQMVCCGKKGCLSCFIRTDSSSIGQTENIRCGNCRIGILNRKTYLCKCKTCERSLIVGFEHPEMPPDICPFCKIPEIIVDMENIPFVNIVAENINVFSKYLGVPPELLTQMTILKSMSKCFRSVPNDPDSSIPLTKDMFQEHDWKPSKVLDVNIFATSNIIQQESVSFITDSIESLFRTSCGICFEEFKINSMSKICVNKNCSHRFCNECVKSQTSQVNPGDLINIGHIQCPYCRHSVKPKHFQNNSPALSHMFIGGKKDPTNCYNRMVNDYKLKIYVCSNFGTEKECASIDFPFDVDERHLGCDVQHEEDVVHICEACVKREVSMQETHTVEIANNEGLGVLTSTGHYQSTGGDGKNVYVRPCPKCNKMIENRSGCFHITCYDSHFSGELYCDAHFCWCCGEESERASPFGIHPCHVHISSCPNAHEMVNHDNDGYNWHSTDISIRPPGHEGD
jgi:hypothetical protein